MSELNIAALRNNVVVVEPSLKADNPNALAATVELLNLGYLIDPRSLSRVTDCHLTDILTSARTAAGVTRAYRPMYPNFPKQVRNLSTLRLFIDQIVHYITMDTPTVDPTVEVRDGLPLADMLRASKELTVLSMDAAPLLARETARKPMALSENDAALVTAIIVSAENFPSWRTLFDGVTNAENRQHLVYALQGSALVTHEELAEFAVSTAINSDDALRAVLTLYSRPYRDSAEAYTRAVRHLSDRDAKAVLMSSVPNRVRNALVRRLGEVTGGFKADRLVNRNKLWILVMRYVHPYSAPRWARDENAVRALDIIHGNIDYRTHDSLVEEAFADNNGDAALELLRDNAGKLYRRLGQLLDAGVSTKSLVSALNTVGDRPKMVTLVSAYNGLKAREVGRDSVLRVAGRANVMRDNSSGRKQSKTQLAAVTTAIRAAMTRKIAAGSAAPNGAVAVSSDATVALVRRDASVSDRSVDRGERVQIDGDGNSLRLFVQWYNGKGGEYRSRVDLDLGAVLLDAAFRQVASVDYTSYHNKRGYATFSGDLTTAPRPNGAAEFIDIDLNKVRSVQPNAVWVAATVNSYTGQRLEEVDHFAGAMIRSDGDKGEIFDPRTVATAFTSISKATRVAPLIVNLRTREMVWIDTDDGGQVSGYSVSRGGALIDAIAFEMDVPRLSKGEFAELYAQAHGADTVDAPVEDALIGKLTAL